jgi:molybdate transport system ATP-binding protein
MPGELFVDVTVPRRLELRAEFSGVTVVMGRSGAGKSTLLSCIAGLVKPSRGRISLGGTTLFDAEARVDVPPHLRRVALVFQSLALFPHLTALENVAYGLRGADVQARAQAWLERTRVGALGGRKPASLSGGEAQRVALARALASEPRALLLDEPFSALDVALRAELISEVKALVTVPTLLVTHDERDAASMGSPVVTLSPSPCEAGRGSG